MTDVQLYWWERILLRFTPLIFAVTLAVVGGVAALVQRSDHHVKDLNTSVQSIDRSTRRVEAFVDDLEQLTPEEVAQNAAVARAVRLVPELRTILCQAFPNVPACRVRLDWHRAQLLP